MKSNESVAGDDATAKSSGGDNDCGDEEKPTADADADDSTAVVPPSTEGVKFYSRNDVLCGRGGGTNVHPGNRRFRDLINSNRRAYIKARKNDKPAISRSIVRSIRKMDGRFLKKDVKTGDWFEIGDDFAREKTSQALRQRAPEMRKVLFDNEQLLRQQRAQQEMMIMQLHQHQLMMGMGIGQMGGQGMGQMGAMGGNSFPQRNMIGGGIGNLFNQTNWMSPEQNIFLQQLAMSGMNSHSMNAPSQKDFDDMTTQTLSQQGTSSSPRSA
ncbi:hypothetical protein ACHAW5_000649 [Stephanodiscus triporus]|uniref:DUF6824 domain-containing protein n=1 Tax=Stephanodiscus triporus TaxID=2934178 RepID=A0ABD3MZ80_9STRA